MEMDNQLFLYERVRLRPELRVTHPAISHTVGMIVEEVRVRAYWGQTYRVLFIVEGRRSWWFFRPSELVSVERE